jgi:hypothetical protein
MKCCDVARPVQASDSNASYFCFMMFTSQTCEHFTELHHSIVEGILIFLCSLHLCQHSASIFEQRRVAHLFYSHWRAAFAVMVSSQILFPSNKQVKIWRFEVKVAAGWNRQHPPSDFRYDLSHVHIVCVFVAWNCYLVATLLDIFIWTRQQLSPAARNSSYSHFKRF